MSTATANRRDQLLVTLRLWHDRTMALQSAWDEFSTLVSAHPDSRLSNAVWMAHGEYTRTVAREIGDGAGWLDWWHYECNLGATPKDASRHPGGPMLPVTTLDDLLDLITGDAA